MKVQEVSIKYKRRNCDDLTITGAEDAFTIFQKNWNKDHIDYKEEFKVMLLSRSNKVLGISNVSVGTTNSCVVSVKEIVQLALLGNAEGVIICHNHPSGNLKPSFSDDQITDKLKKALELFGIKMLDHLILGSGSRFFSYNHERW